MNDKISMVEICAMVRRRLAAVVQLFVMVHISQRTHHSSLEENGDPHGSESPAGMDSHTGSSRLLHATCLAAPAINQGINPATGASYHPSLPLYIP